MNNNLKKALLLSSASLGLLSVSVATADVASAGYASGSASVTNIDGSTYSVGGEVGAKTQTFNGVLVTPSWNTTVPGDSVYSITNLNVAGTAGSTTGANTVTNQVVGVLNTLTPNAAVTINNISPYVSIIRAAAGADGLE